MSCYVNEVSNISQQLMCYSEDFIISRSTSHSLQSNRPSNCDEGLSFGLALK